jgi:pyridoxal phosphate enzyme (YggS family)
MGIAAQLELVRAEIRAACEAAGRPSDAARLIAVSKTHPVEAVQIAAAMGQLDFGENRVQEMVVKQAALPHLQWHMIGTLQRNKVRQIAGFVYLIHSVDSEELLAEIDRQAAHHQRRIPILLQINISQEDQKGGFEVAEAEAILRGIARYPHVHVKGLMGMAEFTDDRAVIRHQFQALRAAAKHFDSLGLPGVDMQELSMGMSGDYDLAIAEGATLVRIGSHIFGNRNSQ